MKAPFKFMRGAFIKAGAG